MDDKENHSKSRKRVYDKFLGVFVAQNFAKIFTRFFLCVCEFGNEVKIVKLINKMYINFAF